MPSTGYFSCNLRETRASVLFQGRLALTGAFKPQKDQESHPDHESCETLGSSISGPPLLH